MDNENLVQFKKELLLFLSNKNILSEQKKIQFYSTGIRVGNGFASMVLLPRTLWEFWNILSICISFNKIIIIQAANTGLTGGSTPFGYDYDRDVVIINTMLINQLMIINQGDQVIAFPGTTLYQLEDNLLPFKRGPHSIIGSSCIGASVIGGVCNNSGGNLVNRGPAYTELTLFAQLNDKGELKLINHLGIELGETPEEIINNLESKNFDLNKVMNTEKIASDIDYKNRVRDISADSPARFNADKRRLFESSGCAGKVAVFAVRLDTFPLPSQEKVFFVGTNNPENFSKLRRKILKEHQFLPEMGEYMNRSYFDGSAKYCKDTFLFIKYFGTRSLPIIFKFKRLFDEFLSIFVFLPNHIVDKILQLLSSLIPDHLPLKIREYRNKFEHYMIFLSSDKSIELMENLLDNETKNHSDYEYIKCTKSEGNDALLHRYVAGYAPSRLQKLSSSKDSNLILLDIALPRNCETWYKMLPREIMSQIAESFQMGHFLCMVFHWDFVIKEGSDVEKIKEDILRILDLNNVKYPAEHNVGHLYEADQDLQNFYKSLDPMNTFNAGIGKTSKKKYYH